METFIKIDRENRCRITFTHARPFDPVYGMNKSRDELIREGFLVEDYPLPKLVEGKRAIPYYDVFTKKVTYEYVAIPDSTDDKVGYLESALNEFFIKYQKNNNDLSQQVTETQVALCDVYELLFSVMNVINE